MANVQDQGPPSAAAIAIGTAIVSGLAGYYISQARSIGLFGGPPPNRNSTMRSGREGQDEESDLSDTDPESGDDFGELKTFPDSSEECKLVLVVRTDLGMGKGKYGSYIPFTLHIPFYARRLLECIFSSCMATPLHMCSNP